MIALITGCSTGIGRLTAETLARAGHTVYASMRDIRTKNAEAARSLERTSAEQNLAVRTIEMDVQDSQSVQRAVDQVLGDAGRIDVLVNNAGHMSIGLAEGFTEEQVARQMDVNFIGPVRACRAVLPAMRAQKQGLIIHVTSVAGRMLLPGCAFYCASKFAQEAYAEVLGYELAGTGVESVLVEPGPYPSHLLPNSPGPDDTERLAGYGELAGLRDIVVTHFAELFGSADAPDTQEVADAILRLVELPAGERPLRTVCGIDFGANALNDRVALLQADALRALGMEQMIPRLATNHRGKAAGTA
jgi:NAD(P)-dependent dehydrogenase (short-subunit alcohol dehydrogenase family)